VKKSIVAPQDIRVDLNVTNGSVLVAEPRFIIEERLTPGQSSQDVVDHVWVDIELRDVGAEVFLA
jgi:hypothetical protein